VVRARERLVLLAVALAALRGLPAHSAADTWNVRIDDALVQPGDVLRLQVRAPDDVTTVAGTWLDMKPPFERRPDGLWHALIGVDVAMPAGPVVLRLLGTRASGAPSPFEQTIEVAAKQVRTRRIRVNPRFVHPPKRLLARIAQETQALNAIFAGSVSERLWTDDAVRPVEGVAVSGFGVLSVLNGEPRGPHNGLDLAAVTGTPVYAPTPGLVVAARAFYYSGNTVILDHGQGLFSTMAHLSAIDVSEAQRVAKGTLLGKVGATGRVTGPHLHWAVRLHGARVDPLSLLDALAPPAATPHR
jgi:murein DD-endopeptidase MepM/ murein hydrolase activator NlpD